MTPISLSTKNLFAKLDHDLRLRTGMNWRMGRGKFELMPVVETEAEIFTVDGLRSVLEHATPGLLPALVIGAFAGLRTAELTRLDWSEVNLFAADTASGCRGASGSH
jgi:hypothetical protein